MEQKDSKKTRQIIEAALFMSSEPVTVEELSRIANVSVDQTRTGLNDLSSELEEKNSALEVRIEPTGIRLAVRKEFEEFTKNFSTIPELNKSVLKTLALVSFRQPVKQSEVIRIRNNKAYEHIKILEDKGFVKREKVGRTFIVYTTKKFVEYFGSQQTAAQQPK